MAKMQGLEYSLYFWSRHFYEAFASKKRTFQRYHLLGGRWAEVLDTCSASKSEALRNAPMNPCGAEVAGAEAKTFGGGIEPLPIEGGGRGLLIRGIGPLH
jgi:hypothetical protein